MREPDAVDRAKMPHLTNGEFPGVTLREAMTSSWRFWAMALAFSLGIIVLNGTLTQIVSILSDRGMTLPEAAIVLGMSSQTVATHVKTIYRKLGIRSRAEAAREAVRLNLT